MVASTCFDWIAVVDDGCGAVRFFCDEMLGRLTRYLRAAGYDTLLATDGVADRDLLQCARSERRHFLTCDRCIMQHNAAIGMAFVLERADLSYAARVLIEAFAIDWLHAPFTRCLVDNALLHHVPAEEAARVPQDIGVDAARRCPVCRRVYWAGSHYRRMRNQLAAWAVGDFSTHDRSAAMRSTASL